MSVRVRTMADLLKRLGGVPLDRIRLQPPPGTATVADVDRIHEKEGVLCELVDGVLLEKSMGLRESRLAGYVVGRFNEFVIPRNCGFVTSPDGSLQLLTDLVRIPDVAFISWDRVPGRKMPSEPIPRLAPNLAVEVLSPSNTAGEMAAKREDYFAAGVDLVWEIDPEKRKVAVYTSSTDCVILGENDVLDGGTVLSGFTLPVRELFAELDRHG